MSCQGAIWLNTNSLPLQCVFLSSFLPHKAARRGFKYQNSPSTCSAAVLMNNPRNHCHVRVVTFDLCQKPKAKLNATKMTYSRNSVSSAHLFQNKQEQTCWIKKIFRLDETSNVSLSVGF